MRKIFAFSLAAMVASTTLYAGLGYWIVPQISRTFLEKDLATRINRVVTIEKVSFNPWDWRFELQGLRIRSRRGHESLLALDKAYLDASIESVWHKAMVLSELSIENLHVIVTVSDANIAELRHQLAAPSSLPASSTVALGSTKLDFAIYNIKLSNSSFAFLNLKQGFEQRLADIELKLPFLGTFAPQDNCYAAPKLTFTWNNIPVIATGRHQIPSSALIVGQSLRNLDPEGIRLLLQQFSSSSEIPEGALLELSEVICKQWLQT